MTYDVIGNEKWAELVGQVNDGRITLNEAGEIYGDWDEARKVAWLASQEG